MLNYKIEFEPVGRSGECKSGQSVLECARYLGVGLASICGGSGKCHACKVQVLRGRVSELKAVEMELFSETELKGGWRLACLTYPESDCVLYVPPESLTALQRLQVENWNTAVPVEPSVQTYRIEMTKPDLSDLTSDASRVLEALRQKTGKPYRSIDIEVLRDISFNLRSGNWKASASVKNDEVIALNTVGSRQLGLAVDAGTTKIAGYLLDLESGEMMVSQGIMNPQISYGEDITSRIHYALKSKDEALTLQRSVISGINHLAEELCLKIGAKVTEIIDSVIVANTAIHHLILRLPVYPLAYPPFCAAVQDAIDIKARDIGLHMAPGAFVHFMPNVAGFVGADHVSMLTAIDALNINELTLAIDIGTNTEVSLIDKKGIYSASCASGPAFEGGHIACGMRAASGAIERLKIEDADIRYQTVDDGQPAGICGSGIIDSIAQMYKAGILDESGRIQASHPGVRTRNGSREFVLYAGQEGTPAIVVTQKDIREIQLGKAAIRAGIQVLIETAGCSEDDIRRIIIAGAFGTYIDVSSAITLGMLPFLPMQYFQQIGNAAGLGARQSLLSVKKREIEKMTAQSIRYTELAGASTFNNVFIQTQYLGCYRIKNGRREEISS
jgi:uncharacterized 2Fe-2S/4Fe-4S cluster protein (DUF4445 family)